MIPRYSRSEMAAVWAPESKFAIWLEIERHALDAQVALGQAPQAAANALAHAIDRHHDALVDPGRIDAIERETRHDVIAFLTNLANHMGPRRALFIRASRPPMSSTPALPCSSTAPALCWQTASMP